MRSDLFGDARASRRPLLVLLGGLPGAGKTHAQHAIARRFSERSLVHLTGDDLRRFHPDYASLLLHRPFEMPALTAEVSGPLLRTALEWSLEHRISVLLEGTFRDRSMVVSTAQRFRLAGFEVHVVALAVSSAVSRLSAEQRFLNAPVALAARWTPPQAVDAALRSNPDVVDALQSWGGLGSLTLMTRDSTIWTDSTAATAGESAGRIVRERQQAVPGGQRGVEWLTDYEGVFREAVGRSGYLNAHTRRTYEELQLAETRILEAVNISQHDRHQMQRRHAEREFTVAGLAATGEGDIAPAARP